MRAILERLVRDERGQDLVEYALLTATIGLIGAASWPAIANTLGLTLNGWNISAQELWVPPDPGGGS